MKTDAGNFIVPSDDSFTAAAARAEWGSSKDFYLVMTNAPGAESWPITATNIILMYKQPKNPAGANGATGQGPVDGAVAAGGRGHGQNGEDGES